MITEFKFLTHLFYPVSIPFSMFFSIGFSIIGGPLNPRPYTVIPKPYINPLKIRKGPLKTSQITQARGGCHRRRPWPDRLRARPAADGSTPEFRVYRFRVLGFRVFELRALGF